MRSVAQKAHERCLANQIRGRLRSLIWSTGCCTGVAMLKTGVITSSADAANVRCNSLHTRPLLASAGHRYRHRQLTRLQLHPAQQNCTTCFLARNKPAARRTARYEVYASAATAAQQPEDAPAPAQGPLDKFKALLSPFSEPSTNKKLLALCSAQALSSVATLIHDTYLPLYLSEELKLSNTKVTLSTSACCFAHTV